MASAVLAPAVSAWSANCILLGRGVQSPWKGVNRLHMRVLGKRLHMMAAGDDDDGHRHQGKPADTDDQQAARACLSGTRQKRSAFKAWFPPGGSVGHHWESFSWADTVRPLTESRTTGVFGTA